MSFALLATFVFPLQPCRCRVLLAIFHLPVPLIALPAVVACIPIRPVSRALFVLQDTSVRPRAKCNLAAQEDGAQQAKRHVKSAALVSIVLLQPTPTKSRARVVNILLQHHPLAVCAPPVVFVHILATKEFHALREVSLLVVPPTALFVLRESTQLPLPSLASHVCLAMPACPPRQAPCLVLQAGTASLARRSAKLALQAVRAL